MVHKAFIPTEVVSISFIKYNTNGTCGTWVKNDEKQRKKTLPKAQQAPGI